MSKVSVKYLLITFSIMILCWGICLLCSLNNIALTDNPLLFLPYLLGGFSTTISSFIIFKSNNRDKGFKAWVKDIFDFKNNILSYLLVVVLGIVYILPQCLINGFTSGAPIFAIVFLIPMMLLGGGLEEAGWRYILQPELENKFNFILSTLMVSVIWWLWHLPLFHIQGVPQYGQNFLFFGINVFGLSFALASIRKVTNSVGLCVLFHCVINSLSTIFIVNENIWGNVTSAIILIATSLILVKVNDKKKLFSKQN